MPFFHNARVFTAYEYLERRFDAKTRSFTALLFLISRGDGVRRDHLGAGCGAVGDHGRRRHDHLPADRPADGVYTMFGGVQAVTWTDVKQMVLIVFGLRRGDRRAGRSACPTPSA